jgi:hypothetical protein
VDKRGLTSLVGWGLDLCRGRRLRGVLGLDGVSMKLGLGRTDIPNSMAQIPVPVARSRTRWGFVMGARFNFPSSMTLKEWCWRSEERE